MIVLDTRNTEEHNRNQGAPRGRKRPFRPREVRAIRARLEMLREIRNLALLNLAIDSKLRGCLLYTSPSPRDKRQSRMPSSA